MCAAGYDAAKLRARAGGLFFYSNLTPPRSRSSPFLCYFVIFIYFLVAVWKSFFMAMFLFSLYCTIKLHNGESRWLLPDMTTKLGNEK